MNMEDLEDADPTLTMQDRIRASDTWSIISKWEAMRADMPARRSAVG